ncbi:MAG: DUF3631 domain-containing protein [Gemmatimonadetes bacterium]|nr:MAG: DUF3631 domain-containing protein [Gemmatimonadota bacterium]
MSVTSNVARLSELESREARQVDAILHDLEQLEAEPDLDRVKQLTDELAKALKGAKRLEVATRRERFMNLLKGKLNAPASVFDAALADAGIGGGEATESAQGQALAFKDPEPWPQPVDGAALLEDLRAALADYLVLSDQALDAAVLWVVHTHLYDAFYVTPRLAITSPEKRCGKTQLLTLLERLVARPLQTANVSTAAVFRCVETHRPTLLIDEADTFLSGKDELRGILNSGHQRGGSVLRTAGDDHEPRAFSTFAPVAIAKIGQLPDTLADRSVAIAMKRKKPTEHVRPLRFDRLEPLEELRRRAHRWATDHRSGLGQADPEVPPELHDRAADNWRPLLAIADAAGGGWPERARRAARTITGSEDDDLSVRVLLLQDVMTTFERLGVERLFSRDLVAALVEMEERPWPEWKAGKPLTVRQLARLVQPFGVSPRHLRIDEGTGRGYRLEDFADPCERYLAPSIRNNRNNALKSGVCATSGSVTAGAPVTDRGEAPKPRKQGLVTDVTDREGATPPDDDKEVVVL